jgi:hypothetical protein
MQAGSTWSLRWQQLKLLYHTKLAVPRLLRKHLRRLAGRHTPILLGPWLSEVGFELLYWIPLVRRVFAQYGIARERVIAVSRGGVAPWYGEVAAAYWEIFDYLSPAEFLEENQKREKSAGIKKQMGRSPFDRRILKEAAYRLGLGVHDVFHPHWMYNLFSAYWRGWMHLEKLCSWCDHSRLTVNLPGPREAPFPPGEYAAAKIYFSDCFPDTPANRGFTRTLLERVAGRMPVVLLNTGIKVDDHDDLGELRTSNLFDATLLMKPANNLAVQTAIVANARCLISTYGGFSYLGPLLGVPAVSFYSTPNFIGSHLQLAHEVLNQDEQSYLAVLPTACADLLWDLGNVSRERAVA